MSFSGELFHILVLLDTSFIISIGPIIGCFSFRVQFLFVHIISVLCFSLLGGGCLRLWFVGTWFNIRWDCSSNCVCSPLHQCPNTLIYFSNTTIGLFQVRSFPKLSTYSWHWFLWSLHELGIVVEIDKMCILYGGLQGRDQRKLVYFQRQAGLGK